MNMGSSDREVKMKSRKFIIALASILVVVIAGILVITLLPESQLAWGYLTVATQYVFSIVIPGYLAVNVGSEWVKKKGDKVEK